MKIKLLTSIAGNNFSFAYGEITEEIPQDEAKRLVEKGLAELVKTAPKKQVKSKK